MSDAETDAARNQEQYFKEHPEESDELINTVDSKVCIARCHIAAALAVI